MKSRDILLGFTDLTTSAKRPDAYVNWGQGDAYYKLCSCCGAQFFGPDCPFKPSNVYSTGIGIFLHVPRVGQNLPTPVYPNALIKAKHEYVSLTLGEDILELTLLVPDDSPTPTQSIS